MRPLRPTRPVRSRLACLLAALTLQVGCASQPDPGPPPGPLRFAVLAAPAVSLEEGPGGLSSADLLLEAVTALSVETDLSFVLVPGPLLGPGAGAEEQELLVGALGSLAGPVFPALAPSDHGDDATLLLEALERGLREHPGKRAYAGREVRGQRVVVLGPQGTTVRELSPPPPTIAVQGGEAPDAAFPLRVAAGEALELVAEGPGRLLLRMPPLGAPPHLVAIGELRDGALHLELRSVWGEAPAPPPPPPLPLPTPGP